MLRPKALRTAPTHHVCGANPQFAVLKETEGRGPYCSLVMAVVVTKDVLVFICFSLNVELSALVPPALPPPCQPCSACWRQAVHFRVPA